MLAKEVREVNMIHLAVHYFEERMEKGEQSCWTTSISPRTKCTADVCIRGKQLMML